MPCRPCKDDKTILREWALAPSRQEWASIFMNGWANTCTAADSPYGFSCPIACCLGTPYRPSATSPGGGSKGRRGRRPLRRGPHPALRATFPVRGEGFVPPLSGSFVGQQSLERRALPARRDAPQDDSEGPSRDSEFPLCARLREKTCMEKGNLLSYRQHTDTGGEKP